MLYFLLLAFFFSVTTPDIDKKTKTHYSRHVASIVSIGLLFLSLYHLPPLCTCSARLCTVLASFRIWNLFLHVFVIDTTPRT